MFGWFGSSADTAAAAPPLSPAAGGTPASRSTSAQSAGSPAVGAPPAATAAGAGGSAASRSAEVLRLNQLHAQSNRVLQQAATADENGDIARAVRLYTQGLEELDCALAVVLPEAGEGPEWEKARQLYRSMGRTRDMVQELLTSRQAKLADATAAARTRPASSGQGASRSPSGGQGVSRSPSSVARISPKGATKAAAGSKDKASPSAAHEKYQGKFKNIDKTMALAILNEVLETDTGVKLDDVIGLEDAKQVLIEVILLQNARPDIFKGIRAAPKGVLLYGPPGNGKTFLAKAVASMGEWTFFNISASSLMSKWVGDGEKMVRALFAMARECQPAIIFIDEVDSILSNRSAGENEAARRLKTEILVQMEGVANNSDERVLVLAATNLPQELDPAAMRRFSYRIYIPLPDAAARYKVLEKLLKGVRHTLKPNDIQSIARITENYSASDLKGLTRDAVMYPVRELGMQIAQVSEEDIRPVTREDFLRAKERVKASVTPEYMKAMEKYQKEMSGGTV